MRRSFCLIALLAAAPATFWANPRIIINKDPTTAIPITGSPFGFSSNASGGGDLTFVNDTDVTWNSLDFFVTLPASETITCTPAPFFNLCEQSSTTLGDGKARYDIGFDVRGNATGILPGQIFSIDLNNANSDCGDWGANKPLEAYFNLGETPVPEPASWLLLAIGLVGAGAFKWRQLLS